MSLLEIGKQRQVFGIKNIKEYQEMHMGKSKQMTDGFYVSIAGGEPLDMSKMSEEERQEIFDKLGKQFIEKGLNGEIVTA